MMKKRLLLMLCSLLLTGTIVSACSMQANTGNSASPSATETEPGSGETVKAEYHKITAEQAKKMMDTGAIILDVRTQAEYDEKHIENAIVIPNETIGTIPPGQLPDKNAVILVYCRSGNRSRQASQKLVAMGYTHIYDFGGIQDWPYKTES